MMTRNNKLLAGLLALLLVGPVWGDGITNPGGGAVNVNPLSVQGIQFVTNNPGQIKSVNFGNLAFYGASTGFYNYDQSGGMLLNATTASGVAFWTDASGAGFVGRMGFGGSTSASPALARSGPTLQVKLADGSADATLETAGLISTGGALPTLTGTCAVVAGTRVGGSTAGSFAVPAGNCAAATTVIVALPTSANGWACDAHDITTPTSIFDQTATGASSITFTIRSVTANAADVVTWKCIGY